MACSTSAVALGSDSLAASLCCPNAWTDKTNITVSSSDVFPSLNLTIHLLQADLPNAASVGSDAQETAVRRNVQVPYLDLRQIGTKQRPVIAAVRCLIDTKICRSKNC